MAKIHSDQLRLLREKRELMEPLGYIFCSPLGYIFDRNNISPEHRII